MLCGRFVTIGVGDLSENATCFTPLSAYTWINDHLVDVEREYFAAKSQARFEKEDVKHLQKVQVCVKQWFENRFTLWNARSQTEGDDLGISVYPRH